MSRLKHAVKVLLGREPWIRRDLLLPEAERHGDGYEAWTVDPRPLGPDSIVYSFGVGEDISFDRSLIERFGCRVHAFDPTPRTAAWLAENPPPSGFRFYPQALAAHDGTLTFHPPRDPRHVSHTVVAAAGGDGPALKVPCRRLATFARERGHERIDLLKMDIEGAEYDVLDDWLGNPDRVPVRQLLVEFHHRFPSIGVERTRAAVAALRRHGYRVFAVTPQGEVSFLATSPSFRSSTRTTNSGL